MVVSLVAPINAEDSLTFHVPGKVTLCLPVNLTWMGGIPPYRLDVNLFENGAPNISEHEGKTGIQDTWYVWKPDFPAGSTLQITVLGSGLSPTAGGLANVSSSSLSSCLNDALTNTASSSTASSVAGFVTPVNQPSITIYSTILTSSGGGLSKGAIAGVAVAAALTGMGLTAIGVWWIVRRRYRGPHLGTGPGSSMLVDPHNPGAPTFPSMSALGSSLSTPEGNDTLRARPYLVEREPTTSVGGSQLRALGPSKRHMRELRHPTSTSSAASPSDGYAHPAGPSQPGYADPQDPGDGNDSVHNCHSLREGDGSEDIAQLDAEGATPPTRAFGFGSEGRNMGVSDVASTSSEAAPPPPYSTISGV